MKRILLFVAVCSLAAGCGKEPANTTPQTNAAPASSGNPLTAPVDYLGAVAKAKQTAVKTIDTASINKAIQLFQVDKDRYPTDLNELVREKYLAQIPQAPYGMKIVYDPQSGQVKVVKE